MNDQNVIFNLIDSCILQKGYRLLTPRPILDLSGDNLFGYVRIKPPRKTISAVWNSERGYFMIQQTYRRKIDPAMFLIRFNDLKDEEELLDDMDNIFSHWNE